MNQPQGRAWWVWYIDACGGVPGIIDACKRTNAKAVFIKGGDGPSLWTQVTPAVVEALAAAGIDTYLWHYTYLGWISGTVHGDTSKWTVVDEITCVKDMLAQAGPLVKGFIVDAEAETEGRWQQANTYVQGVQAYLDGRWFAYAPLPVIDYHTALPYVQFNAACHAVLPQFYSRNLQGNPPWTQARLIEQWTRWSATWRALNQPVPVIMPVGEAYGLATADSIEEFEQLAITQEWSSWSYWSLQHAISNGVSDIIASIAARTPTPVPPKEDAVVNLDPTDTGEVNDILNAMWSETERLHTIVGDAKYGVRGQRIGYWLEAALKGNQDLIKEILGLNP